MAPAPPGFPHGVALPELEDALTAYGPVGRIDMKKGFAFVFMKRNSDADYLVQKLDGSRLLGVVGASLWPLVSGCSCLAQLLSV